MAGFIFAIFGAIIGMLPHNSIAQLDFEDLLSVSPAAEEKAAPADSAVKSAEEKEEAADETASDEIPPEIDDVEEGGDDGEVAVDDKEIEETAEDKDTAESVEPEEETTEETVDTAATEDSPQEPNLPPEVTEEIAADVAEDDFMAQYINEVEQREAAPKSEAMRLMMQKDNDSVLPDDMEKLFEESAKIRQRQRELLMREDTSEEEEIEETAEEVEETAEEVEETAEETAETAAEETAEVTEKAETKAGATENSATDEAPTVKAENTENTADTPQTKTTEKADSEADTADTAASPQPADVAADKPVESVAAAPSAPAVAKDNKAPFGLTWGASIEQTQEAGFELEDIKFGEYVGTRLIKNPQRQQRTIFDKIVIVFGTQNRLNAVFAQSPSVSDLPNAERVLKIYRSYYAALAQKYGNDKEHFIPNKENEDSAIGNDSFLKDLYEGKTSLFATFRNENIRITLAVAANSESESYITLDYENTLLQQQEKDDNLNELMNDL